MLFSSGGATGSGGGGYGFDWGGFANAVGGAVTNIYNVKAQTKLLRQMNKLAGRGQMVPNLGGGNPAVGNGFLPAIGNGFTMPSLPDLAGDVFGGIGGLAVGLGQQLLTPSAVTPATTGGRARAPRIVGSINNTTGKSAFYRYVGAPVLFRGDLTTLRTVRKAVSKFGGLAGARRTFRRRRR